MIAAFDRHIKIAVAPSRAPANNTLIGKLTCMFCDLCGAIALDDVYKGILAQVE